LDKLNNFFGDEPLSNNDPHQRPTSARPQAYPTQPSSEIIFSPEELLNQTFLYTYEDAQQHRAEVVRKLETMDAANHDKFACEQSQSLGHEAAVDGRVQHASP
jgi:hypothetical protein